MAEIFQFPFGAVAGGRASGGAEKAGEPGGLLSDNLRPAGADDAAAIRAIAEFDTTDLARGALLRIGDFGVRAQDLRARNYALAAQNGEPTSGDTWLLWEADAYDFLHLVSREPVNIRMAWPLSAQLGELSQLMRAREKKRFEYVSEADWPSGSVIMRDTAQIGLPWPTPDGAIGYVVETRTACASDVTNSPGAYPAPRDRAEGRSPDWCSSLSLEACSARFHFVNARWHVGRGCVALARLVVAATAALFRRAVQSASSLVTSLFQGPLSRCVLTTEKMGVKRSGVMRNDDRDFRQSPEDSPGGVA